MATQKAYSAKEAEERFKTLPPQVQTFIYSPEIFAALKNIAEKHRLHIDQLALLQAETSSVMLGFTEPQDFTMMLEENLHLEADEAQKIATEINESVLLKIREYMKSLPQNPPSSPPTTLAPSSPAILQKPAELHPADMMLSQKTVTAAPIAPKTAAPAAPATTPSVPTLPTLAQTPSPAAKAEAPKPEPYKADPYREPVE